MHDLIVFEPAAQNLTANLTSLRHLEIKANNEFGVPKDLLPNLVSNCPNLEGLKLSEKCTEISASDLHSMKNSYEANYGSKIDLVCDAQLLREIEELEKNKI